MRIQPFPLQNSIITIEFCYGDGIPLNSIAVATFHYFHCNSPFWSWNSIKLQQTNDFCHGSMNMLHAPPNGIHAGD